MNFLIDAQLPRRLVLLFTADGHDAVHTLDLPLQNRTPDTVILEVAAQQERIVVTKDSDFLDTFLLNRQPEKLLLVSTGNITNADLEALFTANLAALVAAFSDSRLLELTRQTLIIHE